MLRCTFGLSILEVKRPKVKVLRINSAPNLCSPLNGFKSKPSHTLTCHDFIANKEGHRGNEVRRSARFGHFIRKKR